MDDTTQSSDNEKRGLCIIKGCANHPSSWNWMITSGPVSYYSMSADSLSHWKTERRLTWIRSIIRHNKYSSDWQPTNDSMICNAHFVGGKKSEHPLHPSYNPTLFPSQKTIGAEDRRRKRMLEAKQQLLSDFFENEELLTAPTTTEHEPKGQNRKRKKTMNTKPTEVLRKNYVEEPKECEENDFENELSCESQVDYLICNAKTENKTYGAETQVDMKRHEGGDLANLWNNQKCTSIGTVWAQKIEFTGISSVRSDNNMVDVCGLNFKQFNTVLSKVPPIPRNSTSVSNANRLFISLIKLRQGLSYAALAVHFTLQQSLVHEIFDETLPLLKEFAENRIVWIKKEVIQSNMPESFKAEYSTCRAMIDCIQIQVELPETAEAQKEYYKNFKNCNTFKVFIACAPNGFIMYKSKCYGNQKADGLVAQDCGFLDLTESGDVILTDREFCSLEVALTNKGAILKRIDVTADSNQFSAYVHMRKSLNYLKHFKILSSMPMDQLEHVDGIVQICCSLVNLNCLMNMPRK